jgi:ABC-type bacteriocin/lantibiotic exporter with double-glycine peptidase domain
MRFQTRSYSCGAAAVVNALRCFGKRIAERHIWPLADTTDDGTDEEGILKALSSLGYSTSEVKSVTKKEAVWELNQALALFPVILSVQQEKHWVTVIGMICDRYIIVDPARTERSKAENGVIMMSRRELLKYWIHPNGDVKYYGIVVRGHTK